MNTILLTLLALICFTTANAATDADPTPTCSASIGGSGSGSGGPNYWTLLDFGNLPQKTVAGVTAWSFAIELPRKSQDSTQIRYWRDYEDMTIIGNYFAVEKRLQIKVTFQPANEVTTFVSNDWSPGKPVYFAQGVAYAYNTTNDLYISCR